MPCQYRRFSCSHSGAFCASRRASRCAPAARRPTPPGRRDNLAPSAARGALASGGCFASTAVARELRVELVRVVLVLVVVVDRRAVLLALVEVLLVLSGGDDTLGDE